MPFKKPQSLSSHFGHNKSCETIKSSFAWLMKYGKEHQKSSRRSGDANNNNNDAKGNEIGRYHQSYS